VELAQGLRQGIDGLGEDEGLADGAEGLGRGGQEREPPRAKEQAREDLVDPFRQATSLSIPPPYPQPGSHETRATASSRTSETPAASRARAQAWAVAPVVSTSSTSVTTRPDTWAWRRTAKAPATLRRRAAADRPAWGAVSFLRTSAAGAQGRPTRRASSWARTSA